MVLGAMVCGGAWLVAYGSSGASGNVRAGTPATASAIEAAVEANGVPVGPVTTWHAVRTAVGRYELTFARPVRLGVRSWDQTATVVLRSITERRWLVEFIEGHRAVDSQFSFTAAPAP
jgi:hypothetical protein